MQVRYEMARALCVPVTEHTYGDLMLSVTAQRLRLVSIHTFLHFEHNQADGRLYFLFDFNSSKFHCLERLSVQFFYPGFVFTHE